MADRTELLQGTLDLIVLKLLRAGPANGWDLTQSIQVVSKGALDVNYGSLYPALRRLEAKGWLKGRWGTSENNRRARFYELTPAGLKQLDSERQAWERFSAALGGPPAANSADCPGSKCRSPTHSPAFSRSLTSTSKSFPFQALMNPVSCSGE